MGNKRQGTQTFVHQKEAGGKGTLSKNPGRSTLPHTVQAVRLLTDSPMKEVHGMDIKELNLQPRVPFSMTILFKTEGGVWM